MHVATMRCACCPRPGLLRSRAVPLERTAARVCREARATVAERRMHRQQASLLERRPSGGLALESLDSAGQARKLET